MKTAYDRSKFLAAFATAALFAALLAGCLGTGSILESAFFPGAYEGKGQGYRGLIYVRIELSPAGIEDIVITDHREGAYPGVAAMEELLDLVLETGSTDLDAVSGASYSSRGFLEAVDNALAQAREKAAASSR